MVHGVYGHGNMNIENFSASLIPSAAYSRLRDIAASDAANVRHNDIGELLTRPGYRRLPSDAEQIVSIFAHWSHVLGLTGDGELKWDTENRLIRATPTDSLFRSFLVPRSGFQTTTPTAYNADDAAGVAFVSNLNQQLKVIFEDDVDAVAFPFYLPLLGTDIRTYWTGSGDDVYVRFQAVKTVPIDGEIDPRVYPIEAVGRSSYIANSSDPSIPAKIPIDSQFDVEIAAGTLDQDTDADYIDIFQSTTTAVTEDTTYYWIGRIPYAAGRYGRNGLFGAADNRLRTLSDTEIETERTLVEPLAEPAWQLVESSNDRLYLNDGNSNRLWMTYYDAGEKYLRSVTDYWDVPTGGFPITGLKKLQQNVLVIYTENRIFIATIDPFPENHRVIEVITTRDDRDAPIGCIAPESLVDINGYHYFMSGNRQVYRFGGQRTRWMSAPVNPLLAQMPRTAAKDVVGFARELTYCFCYPSSPTSTENDAMLLYDTQRELWWKDSIRVSAVSKGRIQTEYALIDRWPAILDTGTLDNGAAIEWFWKGNKILIPLNTLIHSLFIGILPEDTGTEAVEVSVLLKTEEGEQEETFEVSSANDYWDQIVGFNLRGRSAQVTLSGSGVMKIDRLIFNPEP